MSSDDVDIQLGQSVRRHIVRKESPLADSSLFVAPYDNPEADQIPVFMSESAMRSIQHHVLENKEQEVGGVLLGGFYRNDKGSFIEVTDYIEAKNAKGTDVSLTFTHETWEDIHKELAKRGDDKSIVGWYHSHPALGVFMSKDDEFIHSNFFTDPWHVAVVVDPIYHNWGCFKWKDGTLERTEGFYIFSDRKSAKRTREYVRTISADRKPASRAASAGADRRVSMVNKPPVGLWLLVILLLISQVITGYLLFTRKKASVEQIDYYREARWLLSHSDLSGSAMCLREELANHPGNALAYNDLQLINRILAQPPIAKMDNMRLDLVNMSLAKGDIFAVKDDSDIKLQSSEGIIKTPMDKDASIGTDYTGDDPVKKVLDAYEAAESTRAQRLERAELIDKTAQSKWSKDALKWMEQEEIREITYGKSVKPMDYAKRYKKLPAEKKKAVDKLGQEL